MPRIIPLLIVAIWIASHSASAFSQTQTCDLQTAEKVAFTGGIPTLVGCSTNQVDVILNRVRQSHRADEIPDPLASGIASGIITRQELIDGFVHYYFSTGAGYSPPVAHHPTFTIKAPAQVPEGGRLTVSIHQDDSDGQSHHFALKYDRPQLMADQPPSFEFPANITDKLLSVDTAKGTAGDGDKTINIGLISADEGTAVGDPASVKIVDTARSTYTIVAPTDVVRGDPITFRIDRTGPLAPGQLDFAIRQGKDRISPDGMPHPLVFGAGEASHKLTLPPDFYDKCGQPPTLDLDDGSGHPNSASATFDGSCPTKPGLLQWLQDNVPYWPWPAIPVGVLLGYGLWRLVRRIFNGGNGTHGYPEMPPPPHLYPTSDIEYPAMPQLPDPPEIAGWPKFTRQIRIEWDEPQPPDPLPIAEPDNG